MLYKSPQIYITPKGTLTFDPNRGELPPSLGELVYEWMCDNLVHGEGDLEGEPYTPPQHFIEPLFRLYEYHPDTGRRFIKRSLIGTPKGSAKTEFAGAIAAAEFAAPIIIRNGEPALRRSPKIVTGAASERQADEVYAEAFSKMVAPLTDLLEGPYEKATYLKTRPGQVQRVASKASTNDGKKPTVVIADEFHEWVDSKARNHLVLTNGLSKRADTLELNITTAGAAQTDSPCQRLYRYGRRQAAGEIEDPAFLFYWWQYPETVNYANPDELETALREANPAPWADIGWMVARAAQIPEHEHRRYYGNEWTVTETHWISGQAWDRCANPDRTLSDEPVVLFFDGSYSIDSAALVAVTIEDTPHIIVLGLWENPSFLLDEPEVTDWTVNEDDIDLTVEQAMADLNVKALWYDPWGYHKLGKTWAERWGEDTVGTHNTRAIETVVAPACSLMYTAVNSEPADVTHDAHPGLRRHVLNAIRHDTKHGAYITKDGPHSPRKIDAAYAATMGLWYATHYEEPEEQTAAPSAIYI